MSVDGLFSQATLFINWTRFFYTSIVHAHCMYPTRTVNAVNCWMNPILLPIPLSSRTEWQYCTTNVISFKYMHGKLFCLHKRLLTYSYVEVNSENDGDYIGFDILTVCHRCCHGAVSNCSSGLNSCQESLRPHTGAIYVYNCILGLRHLYLPFP